jgi:hypothetical protein
VFPKQAPLSSTFSWCLLWEHPALRVLANLNISRKKISFFLMTLGGYWLRFHKGIFKKKAKCPSEWQFDNVELDGLKIRNLDPLFQMVHSITA